MRFTKLENNIHLKNYKFYRLCTQYTGYLSVLTRQAIRYIMNSNDTELEQIQAPEYLTSQFITREQVSERTTRSSQKLNIPLFRTASGQRTFYYRTVKLWNNLESFLKLSPSVEIFKRSLRSQLLDNFVNTS